MSKIYYSKTHEYAKVDGNVAVIGISDYAQHALGNVVRDIFNLSAICLLAIP